MAKRRVPRVWLRVGCTALAGAAVWLLAVVVVPQDGWLRPGQVTAYGLAAVVGLCVLFLVLEARESAQSDRARAERRRKRRGKA